MSATFIDGVRLPAWQRTYRRIRGRAWPIDAAVTEPPVCPSGWHIAGPDFVGVGVQRAGTSWWFSLLQQHPLIEGRGNKELHYFDGYWQRPWDADARAGYRRYFPRRPGHLAGEWTPRYMYDPWVPPLLAEAAPEAKLLTILRDPIDRYLSGLAFDLSRGAPIHPMISNEAFARGLYARQLSYLLKFFARRNVLVLQYERCVVATRSELERTLRFLGVEEGVARQVSASKVVNPTYRPKPRLTEVEVDRLVEAYEDDLRALVQAFPEIDLELWPAFRHLVGSHGASEVATTP